MKKLYLAMAVLTFLVFATSAFVVAADEGPVPGPGPGMTHQHGQGAAYGPGGHGHGAGMARALNLSQEQMDKIRDLKKRHYNETKALRQDIMQKRLEARNLFTDPTADEGAIVAKQREISALQQKLRDQMVQLRLEERRILTPEQLKKLGEASTKFRGHGRGRCFS